MKDYTIKRRIDADLIRAVADEYDGLDHLAMASMAFMNALRCHRAMKRDGTQVITFPIDLPELLTFFHTLQDIGYDQPPEGVTVVRRT